MLHLNGQSKVASFFTLSSPEKCWVIFHPFKAKKAFEITNNTLKRTDSLKMNSVLIDSNGGQLDAFKHSFWMASLSQRIGKKASEKLGVAHENGNYKNFKKKQFEDGFLPDQKSSEMDLFNNNIGVKIGEENKELNQRKIMILLINQIQNGDMRILKKDSLGNFLSCEGKIILQDSFQAKWENEKCLIPSNQ